MKCQCKERAVLKEVMKDWYDPVKELPFVNHEPNECKCENDIRQYRRGKEKLWLCSNCFMSTDVELKKLNQKENP